MFLLKILHVCNRVQSFAKILYLFSQIIKLFFYKKIYCVFNEVKMHWYQPDEEEEEADLMFSPALLARRASESWIDSAPIEVDKIFFLTEFFCSFMPTNSYPHSKQRNSLSHSIGFSSHTLA